MELTLKFYRNEDRYESLMAYNYIINIYKNIYKR